MKRSILSNSLAQLNLIEMETDEILKYLNKYLLLRCQYVFKYVFKIYFWIIFGREIESVLSKYVNGLRISEAEPLFLHCLHKIEKLQAFKHGC